MPAAGRVPQQSIAAQNGIVPFRSHCAADRGDRLVHGEHGLDGDLDLAAGDCASARHRSPRLEARRHLISVVAGDLHPGPRLGGFITTYASWHWIFLINVPIGLVGIVMASRFIPNIRVERPDPFDYVGFLLSGCAIAGLAFGLSAMGLEFLPTSIVASLLCGGAISAVAYLIHARRSPAPILDLSLLRLPTFRASIFGGFLFRLGIGALPFLLPLLLQIGFHLTPFQSGLITFTTALGSMFMKAAVA